MTFAKGDRIRSRRWPEKEPLRVTSVNRDGVHVKGSGYTATLHDLNDWELVPEPLQLPGVQE